MPFFKTTILAPGDPRAESTLTDMIDNQPFLLLLVLGNRPTVAEAADLLAGGAVHDTWRRVIWAQDPGDIHAVLNRLDATRAPGLPSLLEPGIAVTTISLYDHVRDVVREGELDPLKVRLFKAFLAAEANP